MTRAWALFMKDSNVSSALSVTHGIAPVCAGQHTLAESRCESGVACDRDDGLLGVRHNGEPHTTVTSDLAFQEAFSVHNGTDVSRGVRHDVVHDDERDDVRRIRLF